MRKIPFDNFDLLLIAIKLDYYHKSTNMICLAVQPLGKQKPKSKLLHIALLTQLWKSFWPLFTRDEGTHKQACA